MINRAQKKRKASATEPSPPSKKKKTRSNLSKPQPVKSRTQPRHKCKALTYSPPLLCYFLSLPRELRGMIYQSLFPAFRHIDLAMTPQRKYTSLLILHMTCHALRSEVRDRWEITNHLRCKISRKWGLLPLQETRFGLRSDAAFRARTIENLEFGRFSNRIHEEHHQGTGRRRHAWLQVVLDLGFTLRASADGAAAVLGT